MKPADGSNAAWRRAEAKFDFFIHTLVFGAVVCPLAAVNLAVLPGVLWFVWPVTAWGFVVALHGAQVFLVGKHPQSDDADLDGRDHTQIKAHDAQRLGA